MLSAKGMVQSTLFFSLPFALLPIAFFTLRFV
jgi:hypothetical protein